MFWLSSVFHALVVIFRLFATGQRRHPDFGYGLLKIKSWAYITSAHRVSDGDNKLFAHFCVIQRHPYANRRQ